MENTKKTTSWAAIVIWFIVFWPVGAYLLVKKLAVDKAAALKNSNVLLGIVIFFIFGVFVMLVETVSGGTTMEDGLFGILFYAVGGALLIYGSIKVKRTGEQYKKFINIVINQQQTTIENIAAQMGLSYEQTVTGIQKMIEKGYFTGAYIDLDRHEIVLPKKIKMQSFSDESGVEQRTVKCPNCGGNNVITIGKVCECEFCGSPIQ